MATTFELTRDEKADVSQREAFKRLWRLLLANPP